MGSADVLLNFCIMEVAKMDSFIDDKKTATANYQDIKDFHNCEYLMQIKADESGDTVCGAHLADGRAYPCFASNIEKLIRCNNYRGPLLEALDAKKRLLLL